MESKEIRELAMIMKETGLTKLDYRVEGVSIRLERAAPSIQPAGAPVAAAPTNAEQAAQWDVEPSAGGFVVKSPMVGVFYCAPGADKEPYVSVGDTVRVGDVLCIIEAMKIMNEIAAERDGMIAEIYAENKQVVEYGQPLFRIGAIQ